MGCLGNILWFILGGFVQALGWFFIGLLWSITIIGLPIGLQCFKMAKMQLAPFGKEVVTVKSGSGNFLLNILWLIFGGIELAIVNLICAFGFAITIIGIPFALQSLKMAQLSLMPFGKEVC